MIAELGHFSLILALFVAIVQAVLPLAGAARNNRAWMAIARPAAQLQFLLVALAFGCLTTSFIHNDFSVQYVANQSNSLLPLAYRVAAVWGGHEGSLLLWSLMLAGWTIAVSLFSRQLPNDMVARVLGVLGLVSIGFFLFILLTSNPFDRLFPPADDGRDLNPLLQDPGLIIHPPMLYMGYVGFSVAFAFAIAALLAGKLDAAWARWSRPWTTAAWMFMTLGIALGSWWAYYELGWGGWWFWDPVENASFMPWLVGTALVHSLAVTEKRGSFKSWTVLLAISAFSLSLMGTFLVRSGVLTSVHAFATDPRRGIFILIFLVIVIGGSLALFAWRAPKVRMGGKFDLASRETLLLTNNVLLVVAAGTVLLGTLYPLVIDALGMGKLSVGPPYFNTVFVPLMVPLLILMALGPLTAWKQADLMLVLRRLPLALFAALLAGVGFSALLGEVKLAAVVGIGLATWIAGGIAITVRERLRANGATGAWTVLRRQPRSWYGMHFAHLGIAITVVGVTVVSHYESEKDVRMAMGDVVSIGGYELRMVAVRQTMGPNYRALTGEFDMLKDGVEIRSLFPEKRFYHSTSMPMTEAAIDTGLLRDVYVSLGEALPDGAWTVRVYHKPMVDWIWGGAVFMALGGLLAVLDKRYRLGARRREPILSGNEARA
ncbi:MAG: heme lyase CcmF/NrfE family subunit [Burkholderiales bacterium]